MDTLFQFDLPAAPNVLVQVRSTLRYVGALRLDLPEIAGWIVSKPVDVELLREDLRELGITFTEKKVNTADMIFGN